MPVRTPANADVTIAFIPSLGALWRRRSVNQAPQGPHGSLLNPSKRPPFFLFPREDRLAASHLLVRGSPRTNPRGESLNADVKRAMVALKLPLMTRYIPGQCECSCVSNNVFLSRGSDIVVPPCKRLFQTDSHII